MKFIHYGATEFDAGKVLPIQNSGRNKPFGGMWASPVDAEFGWKDFCEAEDFRVCRENFEFELAPDARILRLVNKGDEKVLPVIGNTNFGLPVDFEKVAEEYDAIYLEIKNMYYAMYGWDCDSLLVLNPAVVVA